MLNFNLASKYKISFLSGAIVACLGLVVLYGWYSHNIALLQVHPSFAPMQFNTALGFLLAGLSLLMSQSSQHKIASLLALVVTLLGGFTLVEYAFKVDLGIDQLLMQHYVTIQTSHPGRMAPNSALCFFLTGLTLLVMTLNPRYYLLSVVGSIVTGLGLIALLGYSTGISTAYGWGHLTRMAVHAAVGFIILGIGIANWRLNYNSTSSKINHFRKFSAINVTLLVLVIALWQALISWEDKRLGQEVEFEASRFHDLMITTLTSQFLSLERMAQRWEFKGGTPKDEWQADTEAYIQDFKVFQAIEWVDRSFHIQWVVPLIGNENVIGLDLSIEAKQREILIQARESKTVTITHPIKLAQGGNGVLIYTPLVVNQQFDGFILGVIKFNHLIAYITNKIPLFEQNFQLKIFDEGNQIYTNQRVENLKTSDYKAKHEINYNQLKWDVELTPADSYISKLRSSLPTWVLFSGLLMTLLFSTAVFLRQREKEKTLQLQKEVIRRSLVEKSLEQSRQELRLILNTAQEGIYGLDLNGLTTFANPKACELTGYSAGEMQGLSQHTLNHHSGVDDSEHLKENCHIYTALSLGTIQHVDNEVFWRKDGTPFFVEYSSSPVRDEQGKITGAVVTFQDISKRIRHEKELARYTKDLERSNQDLDDFAYVASHDLKAPLRGIAQLTQWIEEDVAEGLKTQTKEYFSLLKNRVSRLEKLLDDLLAYSRIGRQHGDFKSVDFAVLVKETFNLISVSGNFKLVCNINLPVLNTLDVPLQLILRNLINNAIKHHDADIGIITISATTTAEGFNCTVADDGPGIPPEYFERVFGMFQTLKSRDEVEGSGMGLTMIKKILNTYHGEIKIESDGIRGTQIHFNWPSEARLKSFIHD